LSGNATHSLFATPRTLTLLMRKQCPRSQVIWYDAVTTEGKLIWQNTLNDLNWPFFDATDAIFINYSWKVQLSKHMCHYTDVTMSNTSAFMALMGHGMLDMPWLLSISSNLFKSVCLVVLK
jgi:endo-beta-N-acetylglucosaminidase D